MLVPIARRDGKGCCARAKLLERPLLQGNGVADDLHTRGDDSESSFPPFEAGERNGALLPSGLLAINQRGDSEAAMLRPERLLQRPLEGYGNLSRVSRLVRRGTEGVLTSDTSLLFGTK